MIIDRVTNEDLFQLLRKAVRDKDHRVNDVEQMTDKDVVYSLNDKGELKYFSRSYSVAGEVVTLGEPVDARQGFFTEGAGDVPSAKAEITPKVEVTVRVSRVVTLKSAAGVKTRTETYQGREHIVVPVVALVQGVVHAMNARNPEYVHADELRPAGWDGRPIFIGHPVVAGHPVSGNSPDLLEEKSVGTVFNTAVKGNKLMMEAWIDKDKADKVDPRLLERIADGDPIEISVGVFCETDELEGEYEGKKYLGAWHDIVPDHLALLPEGDLGACSRKMGCGVRAAKSNEVVMSEEKKPSILSRVMAALRIAQPAGEMSDQDLRGKLSKALREIEPGFAYVEAFVPVTSPDRVVYSCYEPIVGGNPMAFNYGNNVLYERQFTLGENGAVSVNAAKVAVEAVLSYQPVLMSQEPIALEGKRHSKADTDMIQGMHDHAVALGAYCDPKTASGQRNAGAGAPCSCGGGAPKPQGETEMTLKEKMAKFLETATEDQLKALETASAPKVEEPKVAAVAPVVAAAAPVVAEVKKPTFDELMAVADPTMRDAVNTAKRVGDEQRAKSIKALKDTGRCDLTDEELGKKTQPELDQLVKLAGGIKATVDYGVNAPKDLSTPNTQEAPPAPDLVGAIKAAAQGKK